VGKKRATFGGELRRHREAAGLSVQQLAREVRISRQTVYYLEANVNSPSLDLVLRLADAIGIDARDLIRPLCTPRATKRKKG
jgi:transcriptional regulator with XRE-family HTH domain